MDHSTLRGKLAHVIGADVVMRRWQRGPDLTLYAGLFSVSVLNDEVKHARFVLATVRSTVVDRGEALLRDLPWIVLRLQRLEPGNAQWGVLTELLAPDMRRLTEPQTPASQRCATRVNYDPTQDVGVARQLTDPAHLDNLRVRQRYEPGGVTLPNTLERRRVPFALLRRSERENELTEWEAVRDVQVFIERPEPRHPHLGRRIHMETGLAKESTLVAALNEWRTWIVLG